MVSTRSYIFEFPTVIPNPFAIYPGGGGYGFMEYVPGGIFVKRNEPSAPEVVEYIGLLFHLPKDNCTARPGAGLLVTVL